MTQIGKPMAERFISPHSPPTPRQREILVILIEECAEVQQRATKALRFGMGEIQPGQPDTNSARLSGEIGDLSAILDMGVRENIISARIIAYQRVLKERKLAKYMQTEPPSSPNDTTPLSPFDEKL